MHDKLEIWFILLFVIVKINSNFTFSSYSISPDYAKSISSVYTFTFDSIAAFNQNFDMHILFPSQFPLSTISNCQFKINGVTVNNISCSVNTVTDEVIFSNLNLNQSITGYSVIFTTVTARYSGTSTLGFSYYVAGTSTLSTIVTTYVSISIKNAQMSCSVTSNSTMVGDITSYKISYTPLVDIQANSILQVQLSPWSAYSTTNFITTNTTDICGTSCTLSPISTVQILTYSSLYTTTASKNTSLNINLNKIKNPASTQSITISLVLLVQLSSFTTNAYMNCLTSYSVASPNTLKLLNFAPTNLNISANNQINLRFQINNPISSISVLSIVTTLGLSYQYSFYSQTGVVPVSLPGGTNQLLLGTLVSNSATSPPTILSLNSFTLKNPPYANKGVTITFTTQNFISPSYFLIDRSSVTIITNPSTILSSSISIINPSINLQTTYTIWFITINQLISNSFVMITLPTGITTTNITCSIINLSSSCSVFNSTTIKAIITTIVPAGTNITLTLNRIKNPSTTTPTSSIIIQTYYQDQLSLVDQLNTGLIITATSVPLNFVQLSSSSLTVGSDSSYTLTIQVTNTLPQSSNIKITIPTASYPITSVKLTSFSIGSTLVPSCSLQINGTMILLLTSCITSNISPSTSLKVILNTITNPSSTKPTQSWSVQTFYNGYQMQYLFNGIIATMNTPASITFFLATPTNNIANQQTTYTFEGTFLYQHFTNDRLLINFPTDIIIGSGFQCSAITSNLSVLCFQNTLQQLQVRISYNTINYTNSFKFTISSITNNWYASTRTIVMQTTTNDSTYYFVQQGSSTVNFQPSTITTTVSNDNKIILTGQSTISLTLTSPFVIPSNANLTAISLIIIIPSDLTPINNSCVLSYTAATCALTLVTQTFTINGINDFSSALIFTFNCQTTYFTQSAAFDIKLKYGTNFVASNTVATVKSYCSIPCKQCGTSTAQCISCLPTPYTQNNILFPNNNTCVVSCPSTFYSSAGKCNSCDQLSCLQCTGTATNCTSCSIGKYLYNLSCSSVCPNGYYPSNSQCLSCQSPCVNCVSSNSCLTCINGYFLDIDNKCVLVCSNSSYVGLNKTCQKCISNCLTCSGSLTYCTSCNLSSYILFNNTCANRCPIGYYNNVNLTCQKCQFPCSTCTSLTICLTCESGYYLYNKTTCTDTCPIGTIAVINQCQTCSAQCAACSINLNNCTSCKSGLLFYQFSCISTCPALTYPYNKTCTSCIVPCVTCSSSPNLCQSCTSGLLLLNQTCVQQCPPTGYYKAGTNCIQCQTNCLSCQSQVVCYICSDSYYILDGACLSQCPTNYPIVINRTCIACQQQCASCSITTDNCTTCSLFYFKFSYACVKSCPLTYYSNIVTYQCQKGLSSRVVFFPIFIIGLVVIGILILGKCLTPVTSFFTAITSIFSILQFAIWCYVLGLLAQPIKQPDVNYVLPLVLTILAIVLHIGCNVAFFFINSSRLKDDEFLKQWCTNNINFAVLSIFRYISLIFAHKLYRLCYSRFFKILQLSVPYQRQQNVFPIATIFTVLCLILCQIPMLVSAFSLAYTKLLKDQMFYTCIECLGVTALAALFSLIDIYKTQDYFQESEFLRMKKYIEKVKDSSINKIQQGFDLEKDQGSIQAENYVSKTGGKFVYTKRDPDSFNNLYFAQDPSQITEAQDKIQKKQKSYRINIFNPILEEQAQYYQQEKYDQKQYCTEAEREQIQRKNRSVASDEQFTLDYDQGLMQSNPIGQGNSILNSFKQDKLITSRMSKRQKKRLNKKQRDNQKYKLNQKGQKINKKSIIETLYGKSFREGTKEQDLGYKTVYTHNGYYQQNKYKTMYSQGDNNLDQGSIDQSDSRSMLEYRQRKRAWNQIIQKRQKLAAEIFGKTLQKIQEPADQEEDLDKDLQKEQQYPEMTQNMLDRKHLRRKRKKIKHNKQLEQIYLQRLTQMKQKSKRDIFSSNKALKYDF